MTHASHPQHFVRVCLPSVTEEEKKAMRDKNAARKRERWATLSDEQKAVERSRNAGRNKAKRAGMSPEQKAAESAKRAERRKAKAAAAGEPAAAVGGVPVGEEAMGGGGAEMVGGEVAMMESVPDVKTEGGGVMSG